MSLLKHLQIAFHIRGLATLHAQTCGRGIGVLLFCQRAEVLLIKGDYSAFMPAPYVDARGETDPGLRRGQPMYLDENAMQSLQNMFADGKIPSTVVSLRMNSTQVLRLGWF